MKNIKNIFVIIMIVMSLFCTGCFYRLYLEEVKINNSSDNEKTLEINGITYIECSQQSWEPVDIGNMVRIGYTEDCWIHKFKKDEKSIFIGVSNKGHESFTTYYHRNDVVLPEVSIDGVDLIGFCFEGNEGTYNEEIYDYQTKDFEVINQLFESMGNEQILDHIKYYQQGKHKFVGWLILKNSEFDGIHIMKSVHAIDGNYWINTSGDDYYAKLSEGLIESIVGKEMPSAEDFINFD